MKEVTLFAPLESSKKTVSTDMARIMLGIKKLQGMEYSLPLLSVKIKHDT